MHDLILILGRCLLYDIEQFRYRYVGLCAGIKILALGIFLTDWWLVRRRKMLDEDKVISPNEIVGSIISLDKRKYTLEQRRSKIYLNLYNKSCFIIRY